MSEKLEQAVEREKTREADLLRGACDMHIHPNPSMFVRRYDDIEVARQYRDVGARAIVLKDHHTETACRAFLVRRVVPGIDTFGAIVLNYAVGGLNSFAVDVAIRYGAKVVWMPTSDSKHHVTTYGGGGATMKGRHTPPDGRPLWPGYRGLGGISLIKDNGELVPEMEPILKLIADARVVIATGHISPRETETLVREARRMGIDKIVITHPLEIVNIPVDKQVELAKLGATMEYMWSDIGPYSYDLAPGLTLGHIVDAIKRVGPEHCIISTDAGQWWNPAPCECLRSVVRMLLEKKIPAEDVEKMIKGNPLRLLGLSP